jgi:hypothetical protein
MEVQHIGLESPHGSDSNVSTATAPNKDFQTDLSRRCGRLSRHRLRQEHCHLVAGANLLTGDCPHIASQTVDAVGRFKNANVADPQGTRAHHCGATVTAAV